MASNLSLSSLRLMELHFRSYNLRTLGGDMGVLLLWSVRAIYN